MKIQNVIPYLLAISVVLLGSLIFVSKAEAWGSDCCAGGSGSGSSNNYTWNGYNSTGRYTATWYDGSGQVSYDYYTSSDSSSSRPTATNVRCYYASNHDSNVGHMTCKCSDGRTVRTWMGESCSKPPSPPPAPPAPPRPTATIEVRNVTADTSWTGSNITILPIDEIAVRWGSTNASSCSGFNFNTGGSISGTDSNPDEPAAGSSRTYLVVCSGSGGQADDSLQVFTEAGTGAEISTDDAIVRSGDSVEFTYDVGTSDPSTCEVRLGSNVLYGPLTSSTGAFNYTVTAESTFILDCENGVNTSSATVVILPEFQET